MRVSLTLQPELFLFEHPRPPRLRFHEAFGHLAGEVLACLRGGSAPARQAPAVEGSARR
jgi:hypothetical protein